jgi:transcription elongation factor Elf1
MSLWIDQQYIGIISVKLNKFKRKGNYLYNFRCPICGDSQTNQNKARGYLFAQKSGMFFKCHNCTASMSLGTLIKELDQLLYKKYCLERYKAGETGRKSHKEHGFIFKPVTFQTTKEDNAFKGLLLPIKKLADKHEMREYLRIRKIPEHRYKDLYFVDDIQKFKQFVDGYDDKIIGNEPRLVLPFFNLNNDLIGLSGRAIRGEKLRYVTIRIKDHSPMIFGLNNVDKSKTIYVTEGPIDSLFLSNAIAPGNSNLKLAAEIFEKNNLILVYDNEPRNKEIVAEIKSAIDDGFSVCIWPKAIIEKDINDMIIKQKLSTEEIHFIIDKNTFSGPKAMLQFNLWKKI